MLSLFTGGNSVGTASGTRGAALDNRTAVMVLQEMRRKYDRLFFLVPGYGAQGANARDVQYAFDKFGYGAVVCAGRSILYAYKKAGDDGREYQKHALEAAERMKKNLSGFVTVL